MQSVPSVQSDSRRALGMRITVVAVAIAAVALLVYRAMSSPDSNEMHNAVVSQRATAMRLKGDVHSTDGGPVAAANVCAYGAIATTKLDRLCVTADARGTYELSLTPGAYSVTASAENHASATSSIAIDTLQDSRLDFTLGQQAPTIAGVVSSAAGIRIEAARVVVYQGTKLISNVTTNAKGGFTAWTPPGELIVKVEADGYGAAVVRTVAPTMDVTVTLFPGNVVSGRVLFDGSREPVPNVHVTAIGGANRIVSELRDAAVQTDERGDFTFANLAAGAWTFTVADRHVWGMSHKPLVVTSGKEQRDIELLVRPAGEIAGRFVLGDTDQPCPSGRLQLIPEAMARQAESNPNGEIIVEEPALDRAAPVPVFSAATGENGAIGFDAVPYGKYRLGPLCNEHQLANGPRSLEITGDTTEQLWKFSAGMGVTVRVTDEAGRPIANAAVGMSLQSEQGLSRGELMMAQRSGVTDTKGTYRFGSLRASSYQVSARYSGLNGKAMVSELVDLQSGSEPAPLTLTLPGAGTLRIHAHTPSGASISRVLFFALDSHDARYEGTYGGDGRFVIGPLPRDSYRAFGYDNKNAKMPLNNGSPILIAGTEPIDIDFSYDAPNAFLQGRVADNYGKPLSGVHVRAVSTSLDEDDELYSTIQVRMHGGQEQMTDHTGSFRIEGLESQAMYNIYVDHPSGVKDQRNGVTPGTFVEIAFPATATFVGSVIDARGKSVDKFDVVYNSFANHDSRSQSFTKAGGQFKIENVYPGPVHITIYSDDGDLSAARELTISAGQALNAGQFVLVAAANNEIAAQTDR